MIEINNLTAQYLNGKGIFDLDFKVDEGEIFGYLGPNGAGKTTTIRCLLGFLPPDRGSCRINGLDCWKDSAKIQHILGYIPGEISFFNEMRGYDFLNFIANMRGTRDRTLQVRLADRFNTDLSQRICRMSKDVKQKMRIISAFMHDPAVLILDEPLKDLGLHTQNTLISLIKEEQKRGKTIFLSSDMLGKINSTCRRTGIIKDGHLSAIEDKVKAIDMVFTYHYSQSGGGVIQ